MFLKTRHAQVVTLERGIRDEWIAQVLSQPALKTPDSIDPTIVHFLGKIPDFEYRVLRVLVKRGTIPPLVITAFFDRSMRGKL